MPERITTLAHGLRDFMSVRDVPSQRKYYDGAVSGRFPAHRSCNIWHYRLVDVLVIAATFWLTPQIETVRRRKGANASNAA